MKVREEVDMSLTEFFYVSFWLIMLVLIASISTASLGGAIPFPYGAPFGSAYTAPYLVVSPRNCGNTALYIDKPSLNITGNFTNHQLGDWNLFIHFGACPTANLPTTCDPIVGKTPYCGTFYTGCMSMFFNRDQEVNVIPNSKNWKQTYDQTPYTWGDLDQANSMMGIQSDFVNGARIWGSATNLVIASSTLMWVGATLFFFGPFFKSRPYLFRVTPHVLFALGCLFWCIVLGITAHTSQANPAAWSTAFFETCQVQISSGPVFWYGVAVISFSGLFLVSEAVFLNIVGYYPDCYDDDEQGFQLYSSSVALMERQAPGAVVL